MAQDQSGDSRLPRLTGSRKGTAQKIAHRVKLGEEIRDREIRSRAELKSVKQDRRNWDRYNVDLLKALFDTRDVSDEYADVGEFGVWSIGGPDDLRTEVKEFRDDTNKSINKLESIRERLTLYRLVDESQEVEKSQGTDIFIVHGHDGEARSTVSDFLRKLDLSPIVLQEQGSGGRTIIENFEAHAETSGFAVILLTPDDTGYPGDEQDKAQPRARQNVVLEFGYFWGFLGRERVRVLYKPGVEIPSDYNGVIYIEMDGSGAWQLKLANEIRNAGFEIDLNSL